MKRVTLEEAARHLGISKGAAYKRAQRGTLAKTRGADGRLYIYLDDKGSEATATDARKSSIPNGGELDTEVSEDMRTRAKKSDVPNEDNVVSLTTLANLSAILAAIGLGIYVLGMLSLLIPIRTVFTHDWSAAWYGVAILPRTVAAGQGLGLLAWSLFYYLLALFLCVGIFILFYFIDLFFFNIMMGGRLPDWLGKWLDRWPQMKKLSRPLFGSTIILVIFISFVFVQRGESLRALFLYGTCYLGFELMAVALERRSGNLLPGLRNRRLLLAGAAVIIASAFVIAALDAARKDPGLPIVEITRKTDANNGKVIPLNGSLLAHTDGFWYVFEDEGEQKGNMIAIPDDEVKTVHVLPRGQ